MPMSDIPITSPNKWHEFVAACGGEQEARFRLCELVRMDLNGPMPDETQLVQISESMHNADFESLAEDADFDDDTERVLFVAYCHRPE